MAEPEEQGIVATVQEGSRWRLAKPSASEVKAWFATQPLDDGMQHEDYLSGVVLISASEKVKTTKQSGAKQVQEEKWEMTYTPYVRVDMRVLYFRRLAEKRDLVRVVEPATVPTIEDSASAYFNAQMPPGFWWYLVPDSQGQTVRYLAATWRVALYEKAEWLASKGENKPRPLLEGVGTKQVFGGKDENALMKAETGAIGRALGVAGILVVGTGIATAEDMEDVGRGQQAAVGLPESGPGAAPVPVDPERQLHDLRTRAKELEVELRKYPAPWGQFAAWWQERSTSEGWGTLLDVPIDPIRGIVTKMERVLDQARRNRPPTGSGEVDDGPQGSDSAPSGDAGNAGAAE